jgi:hypothetical protein
VEPFYEVAVIVNVDASLAIIVSEVCEKRCVTQKRGAVNVFIVFGRLSAPTTGRAESHGCLQ